MIELSRALARQFRTMLRHYVMEARADWPLVLCRTGGHGLTLKACQGDVALLYHQTGKRPVDAIAFRATVLGEFEGRNDSLVTLEQAAIGKGRARWDDGGVPREVNFDTVSPDDVPAFPDPPAKFFPLPPTFLDALEAAARVTGKSSDRLALSRVQLRGKKGQVVATDGRQLLVQGGFSFPWQDDVLVPGVPAFRSRDFAGAAEVTVGRTKTHVVLFVGPWALLLGIDTASRYPDVDVVIPRAASLQTTLQLDAEDAAFLLGALPKLPGSNDDPPTITLDLNEPPAVRARGDGQEQATELVLTRSTVVGPPVRVSAVRSQFGRALQLGFREVAVATADKPVVCRDAQRVFLWMPLDPATAIGPNATEMGSKLPPRSAPVPPPNPNERMTPTMSTPPLNGHGANNGNAVETSPERWGLAEVIAETEALRTLLQDASGRTMRLLAALKNQRKKSKAVQAAMASLRQLKIDP